MCPDLQLYKGFLFSAAGTFATVGRGIITALTYGIDVKYCHFDSCVIRTAWPDFVSCSFFSSLNVSNAFCAGLPEGNTFYVLTAIDFHDANLQYLSVTKGVFVGFLLP